MTIKMKINVGSEIEFRIFRNGRWYIILDIYKTQVNTFTRIGMARLAKSNQAEELLNQLPK